VLAGAPVVEGVEKDKPKPPVLAAGVVLPNDPKPPVLAAGVVLVLPNEPKPPVLAAGAAPKPVEAAGVAPKPVEAAGVAPKPVEAAVVAPKPVEDAGVALKLAPKPVDGVVVGAYTQQHKVMIPKQQQASVCARTPKEKLIATKLRTTESQPVPLVHPVLLSFIKIRMEKGCEDGRVYWTKGEEIVVACTSSGSCCLQLLQKCNVC
jgi:hypothetical protein